MKKQKRKNFTKQMLCCMVLLLIICLAGCSNAPANSEDNNNETYNNSEYNNQDHVNENPANRDNTIKATNADLAGEWFYSEDGGQSAITFDGEEMYTAVDPYGAYSGSYYYDGETLELYDDNGASYTGYLDADGDINLHGVTGWFTKDSNNVHGTNWNEDDQVDTNDVNAEDFYGCWEFYDSDEWIYIYSDGTYEYWNSDADRYGPYDYYIDRQGNLVLDDIGLVLETSEHGTLITVSDMRELFPSEPPAEGRGDYFEEETAEGRGDYFEDDNSYDEESNLNAFLEGIWYFTESNFSISFDGYGNATFSYPNGEFENTTYDYDGEYITFYQGGSPVDRAHINEYGELFLDSAIEGYLYRNE